ncbi:MAG TPA: NAD-dependent succinate-semialdehyde dehydrogenase [Actinomycetes bacterium]|nr:NAD-dependent succinate-semialdehyde dehydrogenase [Actinomycetes bacterium]
MSAPSTTPAAAEPVVGYHPLGLYVDGAWCDGAPGRTFDVVDPASERVIGKVPVAEARDVERAVAAAHRAFTTWAQTSVEERSATLRRAAGLLHSRAEAIGSVMSLEQGKPLPEATAEVHRAATLLEWDVEEGRRAYGRIIPSGPGEVLTVRRFPVGPVAALVPWNFPAGGPMRKIAAALSAGCTIVIKPSEEVPGTACALASAFHDAGLPAGVLNVLFGVPDEVSRALIADPRIRFVAFTGSVPVGKHIAGLAAERMKPAVMELGGHAPVIVCADTDPVAAARACVRAKVVNAGQVCTSPSRFYVHRDVAQPFTEAFVAAAEQVVVGPGLAPGVQMGPLASARRRDAVDRLVTDAVSRGARVLTGGRRLEGDGFFYPVTTLVDVPPEAEMLHEEPFGPIAPLLTFDDLDQVLDEANGLPYGLAAYGFTDSAATAERLVRGLDAGILSINHCGGSVPQAPSGGVKESGYGREGGPEGLSGYLVTKRVSHKLAP